MQPCARAWPRDRGLLSASVHSESSSDPRGGRRAGARRRTPEGTRHGEQQVRGADQGVNTLTGEKLKR